MAIIGAHMLLYTSEPDALRAVPRDVFGFTHVDVSEGWLIFALPPSEIGVHPARPHSHPRDMWTCEEDGWGCQATGPVSEAGVYVRAVCAAA